MVECDRSEFPTTPEMIMAKHNFGKNSGGRPPSNNPPHKVRSRVKEDGESVSLVLYPLLLEEVHYSLDQKKTDIVYDDETQKIELTIYLKDPIKGRWKIRKDPGRKSADLSVTLEKEQVEILMGDLKERWMDPEIRISADGSTITLIFEPMKIPAAL